MEMKKRNYTYILLSCLAVLLWLMSGREFTTSNDDASFPKQLEMFDSALEYLLFRYNSWSGRLAIDLVLPFVLKTNIWFWRIANTIVCTLLMSGIWILADMGKHSTAKRKQWFLSLFLFFLFFISKGEVLEWGLFWATGSMNYLWPAAGLILALIPYNQLLKGLTPKTSHWVLILLPGIYSCYQEQTGLILITFSSFCMVTYFIAHKRFPFLAFCVWLIFFINFIVLISAPGNVMRMNEEILKFYPHFNAIPILEKIKLGTNYTLLNHFLYESAKQFVIIPILTFYLVVQRKASKPIIILSLFALSYTVICILFARGLEGDFAIILNLDIYGTISEHTASKPLNIHITPIIIGLMTFLCLPIIWFSMYKFELPFLRLSLFYFASIFSSFILSFSPTMYASGYRIFFVPDIMMIIVILLLLIESLKHINKNKTFFTVFYLIISGMGLSKIINLLP